MNRHHVGESDLALYASGDLGFWRGIRVRLHVERCAGCRRLAEAYRQDRAQIREVADELPEGLDWNRLAAEMTANIRVGLAAGECVAPRHRKPVAMAWRPAAVVAGVAILVTGAWWLNVPAAQTQELGRALRAVWSGRASARHGVVEDRGTVVEATSSGIELRENGSSLGVSQGAARPLAVSVSVQGSASARYVDSDTGQMTITSVYAQ